MSKVIFLDYDGVVNTPMWQEVNGKFVCRYAYKDAVNNYQAVQWLSEVCLKYDYDIVVTSTWKLADDYANCLIKGGLRSGITILGCTKNIVLDQLNSKYTRGYEVDEYLKEHSEITDYLIIDDEDHYLKTQKAFLIKTNSDIGFTKAEYVLAEKIIKKELKKSI